MVEPLANSAWNLLRTLSPEALRRPYCLCIVKACPCDRRASSTIDHRDDVLGKLNDCALKHRFRSVSFLSAQDHGMFFLIFQSIANLPARSLPQIARRSVFFPTTKRGIAASLLQTCRVPSISRAPHCGARSFPIVTGMECGTRTTGFRRRPELHAPEESLWWRGDPVCRKLRCCSRIHTGPLTGNQLSFPLLIQIETEYPLICDRCLCRFRFGFPVISRTPFAYGW